MKRNTFLVVLLALVCFSLGAQTIVISGSEGNRPLTWSDFKGSPDPASAFFANTGWNIGYTMPPMRITSDRVSLEGFAVKLELNPVTSWVKKGRESADLLKHEQGHFDIGRLCQLELIAQLEKAVVLPADIQSSVGRIFSATMEKYQKMGQAYDAETAHSINRAAQMKWDSLLTAELKRALGQ